MSNETPNDTLKFNTTNRPADVADTLFADTVKAYRAMGRQYVDLLMNSERAEKVIGISNKINAIMLEGKVDCLIASLALAVVIESAFVHVFGTEEKPKCV